MYVTLAVVILVESGHVNISSSGDYTFGGHQVTRPETHFNEKFKPEGFDVQQIFVSPSIKYCTNGEVFARSHL